MMRAVLLALAICIYADASYGASLTKLVGDVTPSVCKVIGYKADKQLDEEKTTPPSGSNPLQKYLKKPSGLMPAQDKPDNDPRGFGSCFVIKYKDGLYLITNQHVIEKAGKIKVQFYGKLKHYSALLIGDDELSDIAVLMMSDTEGQRILENIKPIPWGDSSKLVAGQTVIAIGHPLGQDWSISKGIVSYAGRRLQNTWQEVIQTDVSINPGNSGGPMLNLDGKVVGVNTFIFAPSNSGSIGINFSVTSNIAKWVVEQLISKNKVERAKLGLGYAVNFNDGQIYIKSIADEGAAKNAGLKVNDILVNINGREIKLVEDIGKSIDFLSPGDKISVTFIRDATLASTTLTTTLLDIKKKD